MELSEESRAILEECAAEDDYGWLEYEDDAFLSQRGAGEIARTTNDPIHHLFAREIDRLQRLLTEAKSDRAELRDRLRRLHLELIANQNQEEN